MTFQYPFALLALLAIPVLIIIYLLKNKYKEATAPSTYIWEISERFLKRRNPLRKMEHLISLIVQILAIATLAIAVAHPVITLPGQADNIVFVLDTSASMQITTTGDLKELNKNDSRYSTIYSFDELKSKEVTRFEAAKYKIYDVANQAAKGSKFSLIAADSESRVVCKNVDDLSRFELYLGTVEVSQSVTSINTPLDTAQSYFSDGTSNICYLATDKTFSKTATYDNINLLSVNGDEINYAVYNTDFSYAKNSTSGNYQLSISATVISYTEKPEEDTTEEKSKAITKVYVKLYCNDEYLGRTPVEAADGEETSFEVTIDDSEKKYTDIDSVSCEIENEDCLASDNVCKKFNNTSVSQTSICLVSDQPFYFKSVFKALNNTNMSVSVSTFGTNAYGGKHGYDIYIFDSYTPVELPTDGAVWLFGSSGSLDKTGFYAQNSYSPTGGISLTYAENSTDTLYNALTKDLTMKTINVKTYVRYSVFEDFTTILSYGNLPIVFAGRNENNQRQIVFAFDIHNSNLPLLYDFVALMRNCVNYSNPTILTKFNYTVGQSATISIQDSVTKINIIHPSKKPELADISEDYLTYELEEVGTYEFQVYYSTTFKLIHIYVTYPKEESNPFDIETTKYSLAKNDNTVKGDGMFDNILPIVIAAAIVFALDWILYAHEQY